MVGRAEVAKCPTNFSLSCLITTNSVVIEPHRRHVHQGTSSLALVTSRQTEVYRTLFSPNVRRTLVCRV